MTKIEQAIRDAVHETIAELGIDALKATSWFNSKWETDNANNR